MWARVRLHIIEKVMSRCLVSMSGPGTRPCNRNALSRTAIDAPDGTPKAIVEKLSVEAKRGLQQPDFVARLEAQGTEIVGSSPDELAKQWADYLTAAKKKQMGN